MFINHTLLFRFIIIYSINLVSEVHANTRCLYVHHNASARARVCPFVSEVMKDNVPTPFHAINQPAVSSVIIGFVLINLSYGNFEQY